MCLPAGVFATHYRAAEITYKLISGLTYEITIITYTDPYNTAADRTELEVFFGDNKSEIVPRSNGNGVIVNPDPSNQIKKNIYRTTHTYTGPGNYLINFTDQNRVDNINNINGGNSVSIPIYVESLLTIISGIGTNQSPILLLPPIDVGCIYQTFTHNPTAYDPDGDSLTFSIIAPKRAMGTEVQNFTIPNHTDSFTIHPTTGQLVWEKPIDAGHYNWAIQITEFRDGRRIGFVVRDMQVYINNNCDNAPPKLTLFKDECIEANQSMSRQILATDPNAGQTVNIMYYGSPFVQKNSPATMNPLNPQGPASGVTATFNWTPSCNAIRKMPHPTVFRALDNHKTKPLADVEYVGIKVIGPAPRNVTIMEDSNGLRLRWDRDTCKMAAGYNIYRRIDSSYWKHKTCETGVPAYTGYVLYDTVKGVNNSFYFDNNEGRGISPFIRYCYIITSSYSPRNEDGTIILVGDMTESYASEEVCMMLQKTKPLITQVSVDSTSATAGKISIAWVKPDILDSTQQTPPYRYQLVRASSIKGPWTAAAPPTDYPTVASLSNGYWQDTLLNTQSQPWIYKVIFYRTRNGNFEPNEESATAGSPFVKPVNTNRTVILRWTADVPWINNYYTVFRKNESGGYDSIGSTVQQQFADTGLLNGSTYCYRILTRGWYDRNFFPDTLYNYSQIVCGMPVDTIRPCTPTLSIDTPCNNFNTFQVKLNWTYPATCDQDVIKYKILWKKNAKENWSILDTVAFGINTYTDSREALKYSIAGCYAVVAVDSFNNESYILNGHCIDNCPFYQIPNVFTPNGDGDNDELKPFPYRFIDRVDIKIYDRWGLLVFQTSDLNIKWDGKDQKTGATCTEGVYYYLADIFESYLDGSRKREMHGTITLIR